MKIIVIAILTGICMSGCKDFFLGGDKVKSFIPGTYTRSITNEFSEGRDTLIISILSEEANNYSIIRKASYQRLKGAIKLPRESKTEAWTAVYNEKEKALYETVKGKLISFIPDRNMLLVGASEYKKIE